MQQHSYFGSHNVWYGETVHECECGFESHEKAEVEQHVSRLRRTTGSECGQQPAIDQKEKTA